MNKSNKARRFKGILISSALIFMSVLSGCAMFPEEEEVLAPPLVKPKQEEYKLAEVKRGDIVNRVKSIGTLVSSKDYPLYFEAGGRLDTIAVQSGDKVKKGQVLAQLDIGDLGTQIELARINLRNAQIELNKANDNLKAAKAAQSSAPAQLNQAKANLEAAKKAMAAAEAAANAQDAPVSALVDVITAKEALTAAEQAVNNAQAAVNQASDNAKNAQYNVEQRQIDLKAAQIRLDALLGQMSNSQLKSPIDGVVVFIDMNIKKGDVVQPFQTLVQVADPSDLQLSYDAGLLNDPMLIKPDMKVQITIRNKKLTGKVISCPYSMPADVDPKNKNQVIIKADNLPKEAKLGDSADIEIVLQQKSNTLIVPRQAVRSYMGREYVQILDGSSKKEIDVKTGIKSPTEVEIVSGLKEGQKVILR